MARWTRHDRGSRSPRASLWHGSSRASLLPGVGSTQTPPPPFKSAQHSAGGSRVLLGLGEVCAGRSGQRLALPARLSPERWGWGVPWPLLGEDVAECVGKHRMNSRTPVPGPSLGTLP